MIDFDDAINRQTIALSGVFQAAELVKQTAWSGKRESESCSALFRSLFKINAISVEDVYGSVDHMRTGLTVLRAQLSGGSEQRDSEVARYTAQILALQKKLMKDQRVMQNIGEKLLLLKTSWKILDYTREYRRTPGRNIQRKYQRPITPHYG